MYDAVSLVASIASLILAILAIVLSIVFYRFSASASNATIEASKGIAASVERLEKLFDKLYSDTFSMMRDTVADMRKHMWPEDPSEQETVLVETEGKADEKINNLKESIEAQLQTVLQGQKLAQEKNQLLQSEMRRLIDRAILSSRRVQAEARNETVREHILRVIRTLRRRQRRITADGVVERLADTFPASMIVNEMRRLREEGIIDLDSKEMLPGSEIKLKISDEES
jgi:hypothetical protein